MNALISMLLLQLQSAQFDPSRFQRTGLAAFEAKEDGEVPDGVAGIDTTLQGLLVPCRPSGKARALPTTHKGFMAQVGKSLGDPSLGGRAATYTQEVEVVDRDRPFWVAVSDSDAVALRGHAGENVEVAVRNVGSIMAGAKREHVYLVVNFRTLPEPAAEMRRTYLTGRSADVAIALPGFVQDVGPGSLGGSYERLGQFTRTERGKSALQVSVLVDTLPAGFDLARLKSHVLDSYRKRFGGTEPRVIGSEDAPAFLVEWEERLPTGRQWHTYYETLAGPRWVEVHFSVMQAAREDLPSYRRIVASVAASMKVTPKMAGAPAK